jgi:hypothetical protein
MSIESKIKFRVYAFVAAGFVVLAFIVGILYALWVALLVFLLWKAYKWLKVMRWWKSESQLTRQMAEYITSRTNEGMGSSNLWVTSLTVPEVREFAVKYHAELMARNPVIEKESANLIEGWTKWGASRLEEHVLSLSAGELSSDVGTEESPMPFGRLMIARTAFEIQVAEHALELLNVPDPRAEIARRILQPELAKTNAGREGGNLGQQLLDAAHAEALSSALKALAAELGEGRTQRT